MELKMIRFQDTLINLAVVDEVDLLENHISVTYLGKMVAYEFETETLARETFNRICTYIGL